MLFITLCIRHFVCDHRVCQYTPALAVVGVTNSLWHFFRNLLNTFPISLSEVIIIGRTGFVYLVFDVAPMEVVWYCRHIR